MSAGPPLLALLAGAYAQDGRVAEGLQAVADGLSAVEHSGERLLEADLWRLKGELTLPKLPVASGQLSGKSPKAKRRQSRVRNPQSPIRN